MDELNKITAQMEELFELEAKYGCAVSHGEKGVRPTYEQGKADGMHQMAEAISAAFREELYPTTGESAGECPDNGWDWHTNDFQGALERAISRAAQEKGVTLDAPAKEQG